MEFFDILYKNTLQYPDRIIFEDELYGTYTFSDIECASAKIYSYLATNGVTKEDIVVIRMKRSARIFLTMLGVWKAGAAFVVIGEHSPENYVNQVLYDAEGGFVFSDVTFDMAMQSSEKEGWEKCGEHDLACLIYATGSSGCFKGSMHEYGAIAWDIRKFYAAAMKPLYETGEKATRNVMFYPLYSIDCIIELLFAIFLGNYYYVVPYGAILDFSKLAVIITEKRIETICLASNNYRKLKQFELPHLKRMDLSLDVNIDELDMDCIYSNTYALTEAFGWVTCDYIEKKQYDIIPSGKPCPLTDVKICDNTGAALPQGKIGEICVFNPFFRGYMKRPDLTANILHHGWIHTGDIGYFENDGNLIVFGRKIDMLETENGLIIPTLISVQVKKHFPDIEKSYVKLFQDKNKVEICLYYCGSEKHSLNDFISAFKGNLPDYMMPTHCVKKDDFKFFDFGKIDRLSFEKPE